VSDGVFDTKRCGAPTKSGLPCRTWLNLGATGLCLKHDPDRIQQVREMNVDGAIAAADSKRRAKAGQPKNVPNAPKSLRDAVRVASWITRAVLVGEIDVRVAEAATKAVRQFQLGLEKKELQDQVEELQALLAAAKK
jgi:hypothetical protein